LRKGRQPASSAHPHASLLTLSSPAMRAALTAPPHVPPFPYVSLDRCIKPNASMTPGVFNNKYVVEQLQCLGILQTCEVRTSTASATVRDLLCVQRSPTSAALPRHTADVQGELCQSIGRVTCTHAATAPAIAHTHARATARTRTPLRHHASPHRFLSLRYARLHTVIVTATTHTRRVASSPRRCSKWTCPLATQ
jgi:hypothetical protein